MSSAKHTSGDWRVTEVGGETIIRAEGMLGRIATIGECRLPNSRYDDGCKQANARLIAAAPDLLAALESAADEIDRIYRSKTNPAAVAARAALAKAQGE